MHSIRGISCQGLAALLVVWTSTAYGADLCKPSRFEFDRRNSRITVGPYKARLENPDDENSPAAWEGPVTVTRQGSTQSCTIDVDIGIISKPLLAFNDDHLALYTYSGSSAAGVTLDLAHCSISAQMKPSDGAITTHGLHILLDGKPVKGLTCADK